MLFWIYYICYVLCDETSTKICLYSTKLPDECKNIVSLDVSKITDLDAEIQSIKTNKMILLFAPSVSNTNDKINYKLKISTFSKSSVNLSSLGKDKEKFNLDLTIDHYESTYSIVQFEDCSLHFIGISDSSSIKFDWVEIYRCDISFNNIDNKITAQAAVFDSSFKAFSEITIEGGHRNPDFTIKNTETLSIELKEYENIINSNIHIIYTNPTYRDIEIIGSQHTSFYCSTSDENKISTVFLTDIENLYYNDSTIEYPTEYTMTCHNIHNIHSDETTIPVTLLEGTTTNSELFYFTNIYVDYFVDISGDIKSNVTFLKETTSEGRTTINIKGTLSSKLLSINNSFIELEIANLNIDMNKYLGHDPFIHCIGKGGVSSITAYTDYEGYIGFSRPLFNRDFDTFLSEEDIQDYIDSDLNYLMLSSKSNGFESNMSPSLTYVNNSFIHGFSKDDSVVDIFRTTVNPLVDTISISNPSLKLLKLCYNDDCKGGIKVQNDDLKDLSKGFIFQGMKNVALESSSDIDQIDFSNLYENLNFSIYSTSSNSIKINSMNFNSNLLINYTYKNIILPSLSVDLINITFWNCSFISKDSIIKTTTKTNIQIDSDFLINGYLASHFQSNPNIDQLSIQIDSFTEIHMTDSGFRFVGNKKDEYTISKTTTKWNSILFKKDSFNSNSLTLSACSNNPSFNLTIETSKKNDAVFSLKLVNWSQIKESNYIAVNHSTLPLQIVMTEPEYINPIVLTGKGKVIYSHEYSSSSSICACENTGKADSFPNCRKSDKIISFSQLNEALKTTEFDDLTVVIAGSSKEDDKHPTIDMESLNKKIVNFTSEGGNNGFITIDSDKQLKDPQLSETFFYNIDIYAKSGSQSKEFVFGELSFINSNLNGFVQSTFKINYFTCDTQILNSLNEIYITDNLIITGDFDLSEKTIHFVNDDNSEDLKAFILKNSNIVLGEGKVKIGKITFLIEKSDDFDIVFNINNNLNISFECEKNSKFDLIPPIQVNRCQNVIFDFTANSNNWPTSQEDGFFLIDFVDLINATLILAHEETPLKIESISGQSKIIGKASTVGITGQITNSETSDLTLSFEKTISGKCELKIDEMRLSNGFTFSLLQADLSATVTSFSNNEDPRDKEIKLKLYLGLNGLSSLQVKFIDEEVKFFTTVSVLLDIPSSIKLDSQELNTFCSKNYTLIRIPIEQDPDFSLDIDPVPELHGLTEEAFAIMQNKYTKAVIFYTKVHPRYVPFSMCYKARVSCEIQITEGQLIDLTKLIPSGIKAVEFNVGDSIINDLYLNLDLPIFDGVEVEIKGENIDTVSTHLGFNRIEKLTIDGIKLNDMPDGSYHAKKLVVTGSLVSTVNGFDNIEFTDPTSWAYKNFSSFSGNVSIVSYDSKITFDSDGWIIGNDIISSSQFPNLKVVFQPSDGKLLFDLKSESLIPFLRIYAESVKDFQVSKGWSNVEFKNKLNSFDGLLIENIDKDSIFTVQTSSFPFFIYPLNISQSENQVIKFSEDIEISDDKISLKNTNLNIDNSKSSATINEIEFSNDSVLNNSSPIKINTLITKQGNFSKINQATIYEKLKIIGESEIEGQIDFDANPNNEIEFVWDLNETPELLFTEFPKTVVVVNVHFQRDSISNDEIPVFNDFLYQKAFRLGNFGQYCDLYKQNLKYTSSYKYFDGDDSIFDSYCDDGELLIQGKRKIPIDAPTVNPSSSDDGGDDDDDSTGKNKKKLAIIVSLSIIIPLFVIGLIVIALLIYRKSGGFNFDYFNQSESMEVGLLHQSADSASVQLTRKYTENL
ncbi:hypothetical protein M9Y10_001856 [Tritrichomonas musculus]|uniref:Uncharacterized protein n=1 Tax=Tritrichomonas musculus TaxID=1915356 RepID=A0ABR2LB63_9EUKA